MKKVSLAQCTTYEKKQVQQAVGRCIDLLGGMQQFVQPKQRVLLKINLLSATPPEKAVTTHPAVIAALATLIREAGAHPVVADSPGPVPYTPAGLKKAYRATGLLELAETGLVELNYDTAVANLTCHQGIISKGFEVIRPAVDCDVVIAIPKFKTHMFTTFTGATKILFGVIPGLAKAGYHAKLQTGEQFAQMLLDLIMAVKPTLYLMDGIVALEGDGPGLHGEPRQLGVVLASRDPVAMDAAACGIAGIDPLEVPMLRAAVGRGWWTGELQSIEWTGSPLSKVQVADFKKPARVARDARGLDRLAWYLRIWAPVVKRALTPRPVPNVRRCSGCATCHRTCPQGVVTMVEGRAIIDDKACIRCYCCHEMCPDAAIDLEYGAVGRLIRRLGLFGSRD